MHFLDELAWRGLLHQATGEDTLRRYLETPGRIAYAGFDPTAPDLTIGNFIPIKMLMHWQRCGHKPVLLVGGGTGLIGDPSGKDAERRLLSADVVSENVARFRGVFERLLDFDAANPNCAVIVDNADWLCSLGFIDVLRDVGKHFSVNEMITRDSVRTRLEEREQGISYTEFSYMLLQAYDYLHLRREMNCTVQMAGSDQFGNIVSGIDLIRRAYGHEDGTAYGVTAPLITRADGKKIGKTETGAVWLSAESTSPYAFYQYWVNTPDTEVISFIRKFTLLEAAEVDEIAGRHEAAPHERHGQKALASHMTALLHGADALASVEAASQALFSGNIRDLDATMLAEVFEDVPHSSHGKGDLEGDGVALLELLPQTSLANSKREAREFLSNGAVAVNGVKVDLEARLGVDDLLHGTTVLLRRGKKRWHATQWA